jgi:hypothetical protein
MVSLKDARVVRSTFRRLVVGAAVLAFAAVPSHPAAGQQEVPPDRRVLILVRALSYDGELKARAGDAVAVAILSKRDHGPSEAAASTTTAAFKKVERLTVAGLPIQVVSLIFAGGPALEAAVGSHGIDVVYVCPGLDAELAAIMEITRKRRLVSIGGQENYLSRGLALGAFLYEGKPAVVINLPAARSEGSDFSSELLRVARVLK